MEPVEHRFNRSQNKKACSGRSQAEPESLPNTVSDFPMPACAEELRAQYRLGYTPTQDAATNGYHRIDLALHQKGLVIQTRDGYYTGK